MTAKILVVDDVEPNVRLLEAKLTLEYYDVVTASNGPDALRIAAAGRFDLIIIDAMMPGMNGFEVCQRLKSDARTRDIPLIIVTALDGREDRIRGLEAGAAEFLTKPLDDVSLFATLRRYVRAKADLDTLSAGRGHRRTNDFAAPGRVVLAIDRERPRDRIERMLDMHVVTSALTPADITARARESDVVVLDLTADAFDGLRVLAQLRSDEETRTLPVLVIAEPAERPRWVKALELGADAIVAAPVDSQELALRVGRLVNQKRQRDAMTALASDPPPEPSDELSQVPAPYAFRWTNDQIDVAHSIAEPSVGETAEDVLAALQVKIRRAKGVLEGNHADPRLLESLQAFSDAISIPAHAIRPGPLLMAYRSLQADATAFLNPVSEREATVASCVADVSLSAADLVALYPGLRAIEEARYALDIDQPSEFRAQISEITEAAAASNVVSAAAVEALRDLSPPATDEDRDLLVLSDSARTAYLSKGKVAVGLQLLSVRNFCAAALKILTREVLGVGTESLQEARKAIPRGVGAGVEKVVSGSIVLGLVTLVASLAGPLAGVAALAVTFRPLAQRAEQIRKAILPPDDE